MIYKIKTNELKNLIDKIKSTFKKNDGYEFIITLGEPNRIPFETNCSYVKCFSFIFLDLAVCSH